MNVDLAYEALAELRDALPRLGDALIPGTPRRWTQRGDLTAEQRDRQDAQALAERGYRDWNGRRGLVALGESPAPVNLSALEARVHIEAGVLAMERTVCEWLGLTPLAHQPPKPRPYGPACRRCSHGSCKAIRPKPPTTSKDRITRVIGLLDRIATLDELARWVTAEASRLARHARGALGDAEPVHKIDARCPICAARSLRAFPERELIICVNEGCACGDESCACHNTRPRRHRWPYERWGWLAQVLGEELETA